MESTTVKLYSLNYGNVKTYLAASLFIVGNILFPQFFHLIPQGGITWLPIYYQLLTFWYADIGAAACYLIKVCIASHCCRLGRTTLRAYFYSGIGWRGTYLSSCRNIGRVDVYW